MLNTCELYIYCMKKYIFLASENKNKKRVIPETPVQPKTGIISSTKTGIRCFDNGIRHFDVTKLQNGPLTPFMIGV